MNILSYIKIYFLVLVFIFLHFNLVYARQTTESINANNFLKIGVYTVKEIHPTEKHIYVFEVPANSFLSIEVEQRNIPIDINILDKNKKSIYAATHKVLNDFPIYLQSDNETTYYLEIFPSPELARKDEGTYAIKLSEMHSITPDDEQKIKLKKKFFDTVELNQKLIDEKKSKYKQYLETSQQLNLEKEQVEILFELGELCQKSSDPDSEHYLRKCIDLSTKINCSRFQAKSLYVLATAYQLEGNYDQSLKSSQEALEKSTQTHDYITMAETNNILGEFYIALGEYEKAIDYCQKSLVLDMQMLNFDMSSRYTNIAVAYGFLKNYEKSLEYLEKALSISKRTNSLFEQGGCLANIGMLHQRVGNYEKAINVCLEALPIIRGQQDTETESVVLSTLGNCYYQIRKFDEASNFYMQGLALHRKLNLRKYESITLDRLAILNHDQGKLIDAKNFIESSIKILESLHQSILIQNLKESYFSQVYQSYKVYIDVLMALHSKYPNEGYDALAFEASEKSRARNTLELLLENKFDFSGGVDENLVSEYQKTKADIESLSASLVTTKSNTEKIAIENQLKDLELKLQLCEAKLKSNKYIALVNPKIANVSEVQNILDDDSALLEYSIGTNSWMWVITKKELKSFQLADKNKINSEIQNLHNNIANFFKNPKLEREPDKVQRLKKQLDERSALISSISDLLLNQAKDILATKKKLLVVGDQNIYKLPFCILQNPNGSWLTSNHEITNLVSVTTLINQRLNSKNNSVSTGIFLVGDPIFDQSDERLKEVGDSNHQNDNVIDNAVAEIGTRSDILVRLPFTREEVLKIKSLNLRGITYLFLDFNASIKNILANENLEKAKIIHLASHALVNKNPLFTGIVLSLLDKQGNTIDGFLSLQKIFNLKLSAELVVLSGCQTSLGKEVKGEGLIGFGQAFSYAGARRVLSTSWKIDDKATAEFMEKFYYYLLKAKISPGAALRKAQLDMLKTQYSDPYFWGAFTIQGEPN